MKYTELMYLTQYALIETGIKDKMSELKNDTKFILYEVYCT